VNYVSPEQARGETTGPQADLYSLGATLFEMLTGKPPFNGGDRLAVLHKHVYDRPPRPGELRPGLPPEVDSVVAHCLEKDLSRRFASAREVRSYLAACPREEETRLGLPRWAPARAAGPGFSLSTALRWTRQRALWIGLAVAVLAAAGGIGFWATGDRAGEVKVPDVIGMSAPAARELIANAGLGYREVGTRPDDDVVKGAVLSQQPRAGSPVAPDTVVKVVLSNGASRLLVPDVTQMSVAQAQRNLEAAGLVSGVIKEDYSVTVPAGYVAGTLPAAGARVVPETTVDIVLSLGPEPPIPVGPPAPTATGAAAGRDETLTFALPADLGKQGPALSSSNGPVTVTIEVSDDSGRRTIYQGRHRAGERVPAQKIHVTSATTARIYLDGKLHAERQYLP
jgi:serine/threonine-protein kinase